MRDLLRNQTLIYYANGSKSRTETDEWGNSEFVYGEAEPFFIALSAAKGSTYAEGFGASLDYDREMVTHNMSCPINEYSHLWLDCATTEPYNYVVTKVARSPNSIRYAIKRVNVSENQS